MSTARLDTKTRLLDAARMLVEQHGPHGVRMEDIASKAGVSRQSAYLHFHSKTGLLLALVAHVDSQRDVNELVDRLWSESDALAALDAVAELAARTNPEVHRIGIALDTARRWDEAFEAAWQDRMNLRLRRYRRLVRWLQRESYLGSGWTIADATSFIWSMTSIETYDQLVVERRMSLSRYAQVLRVSLRAALTAESPRD